MIHHAPRADLFKRQLNESLQLETRNSRAVTIAKNENVYTCGDESENVYFIESGQVKLTMFSPAGKECILAIYTGGDVFGELCLSHPGERPETATAMTETILKKVPRSTFLLRLTADSLLEGFIGYLAVRISDLQDTINNLVTVDSEQRLGKTLLRLAGKAGRKGLESVKLTYKITHEELSAIVGTTRPRISHFMVKFRELGLIELSADRFIIINKKKLDGYLDQFD